MGRLVGLPHFLSEDAMSEEKADTTTIRRAKGDTPESQVAENICQVQIARRMQAQFDNRIIRRTISSLDWEKKALITVPPYEERMMVVKPTLREMEIITDLADRVKER